MFVVLKDNGTGINNGFAGFRGQENSFQNAISNGFGWNNTGGSQESGLGTIVHLNNGFGRHQEALYGKTLNTSNLFNGGQKVYSLDSNIPGTIVETIPHGQSGYVGGGVGQTHELHVVNPLTGQIVSTLRDAGFSNSAGGLKGHDQQLGWNGGCNTTWNNGFGGQKSLTCNLIDNDQTYVLECYSPEFDTKNSEVTLTPNGLRIRVNCGKTGSREEGFYTIPTPCDVDKDKITAHSSKGFLKINLPRSKKALESIKKIKVD